MKKITVSLSYDWIKENREQYGNIVRKTWKEIQKNLSSAELVTMGVDELQVKLDDKTADEIQEIAAAALKSLFSVEPEEVKLEIKSEDALESDKSDKKSSEEPVAEAAPTEEKKSESETPEGTETTKEEDASQSDEAVTSSEAETSKSEKASKPAKAETPSETETPKAGETDKATEKKKAADTDESSEKSETSEADGVLGTPKPRRRVLKADSEDTTKKPSAEKATPDDLEAYCKKVPMKYSSELKEYISELLTVSDALKQLRVEKTIWAESLLVSINSGYGFETFAETVNDILLKNFPEASSSSSSSDKKEFPVYSISGLKDPTNQEWSVTIENIRSRIRTKKFKVIAVDISACTSELTSDVAKSRLRTLAKTCSEAMVVFRVPCVEMYQLAAIRENLADIMAVRSLLVAPASIEEMVDYVAGELTDKEFYVSPEAKDCIEELIVRERVMTASLDMKLSINYAIRLSMKKHFCILRQGILIEQYLKRYLRDFLKVILPCRKIHMLLCSVS